MKKITKGLLLAAMAVVTACDTTVVLTAAEFEIALQQIALTVPLVVEKTVGVTIPTNIFRTEHEIDTPILKDGNALALITEGKLSYEDEDEGIYLYPDFSIEWSFLVHESYGTFTFETDRNGEFNAIPEYPIYVPEYDGGGNPIHILPAAKAARLYATVRIGSHVRTVNIDVVLSPQPLIEYKSLLEARELESGAVVGVRGYVHGIFTDWNAVGIADGRWGLGLYRLDSGFPDSMEIGDLVEVVGQAGTFNGLSQLSWIKSVKVLDPADWPDIKTPEVQEFSLDDLADQLDRSSSDLTGPLQDKDNSLVKFTEPFRFKRVEDRDATDVGFAGFDTTGSKHTNVILEGTTSTDDKFEIKLSMNYHMKGEEQLKFKTWLEANQNSDIYYNGPLSQYNELVLGPYHFIEGVTLTTTLVA